MKIQKTYIVYAQIHIQPTLNHWQDVDNVEMVNKLSQYQKQNSIFKNRFGNKYEL